MNIGISIGLGQRYVTRLTPPPPSTAGQSIGLLLTLTKAS